MISFAQTLRIPTTRYRIQHAIPFNIGYRIPAGPVRPLLFLDSSLLPIELAVLSEQGLLISEVVPDHEICRESWEIEVKIVAALF